MWRPEEAMIQSNMWGLPTVAVSQFDLGAANTTLGPTTTSLSDIDHWFYTLIPVTTRAEEFIVNGMPAMFFRLCCVYRTILCVQC